MAETETPDSLLAAQTRDLVVRIDRLMQSYELVYPQRALAVAAELARVLLAIVERLEEAQRCR